IYMNELNICLSRVGKYLSSQNAQFREPPVTIGPVSEKAQILMSLVLFSANFKKTRITMKEKK
ncbi:hypothetical protein DRH13_03520, partial [Candidatus Woesebacteria bacterium]